MYLSDSLNVHPSRFVLPHFLFQKECYSLLFLSFFTISFSEIYSFKISFLGSINRPAKSFRAANLPFL